MVLRCALFFYILLSLFAACRPTGFLKAPEMLTYFQPLQPTDTLHVEISDDTESVPAGDTIPNRLFFTTVPPTLLQEIDYLADSSQALVLARQYFSLTDNLSAYLVDIRQFWFQHQSLLVYDRRQKTFIQRITLAEWYGGDGGQVLTGSWVFDFDGDGQKDILRREIQHSMVPTEEGEPLERIEQSASLLLWKNGGFVETALADTAGVIRRFPIRSFWE